MKTDFGDLLWPDTGQVVAKNSEIDRHSMKCTVMIEQIFWKKATFMVSSLGSSFEQIEYKLSLAK